MRQMIDLYQKKNNKKKIKILMKVWIKYREQEKGKKTGLPRDQSSDQK